MDKETGLFATMSSEPEQPQRISVILMKALHGKCQQRASFKTLRKKAVSACALPREERRSTSDINDFQYGPIRMVRSTKDTGCRVPGVVFR